ncbi:hypothetical protein PTKIN_Ptkin04bG0125800 [Pterospermum kingtungense]
MGRVWYWGNGAKASNSSKRSASERDTGRTTPTGCISAVFYLFNFHHFQFPLNNQISSRGCSCFNPESYLSPDTTTLKGVEAPRNSLESEEDGSTSASLTSTSTEKEILNIPRLAAPRGPRHLLWFMGLDLLPENRSPSFSSASRAKSHLNHHINIQPLKPGHIKSLDGDIMGTRSLPETPRTSSARRSVDVDHHHRLSLQINKENMSPSKKMVISRLSSLKRIELKHEEENRSPGHYARQIAKQVKESVSRKVGMDITNTVRNREQAREELVSQFKCKNMSKASTKVADESSTGKAHSTPSCSPRLRFLESKSKPVINSSTKDPQSSFSSTPEINTQPQTIKLQPVEEEQDENKKQQLARATSKCKMGSSGKFGSRLKKSQDIIRNKQEEPFVRPWTANRVNIPDKRCRKTPLSNGLLNITRVPTLPRVKKDASPPPTDIPKIKVLDARRPKRSSQLSSYSSQTNNKQETTQGHVARDNNGNRFGHDFSRMDGCQLIETLCSKIRSFPQADCRVLEDIDALIEKDLPEMKFQSLIAYDEEGKGIVTEIEKDILEALVHETVVDFGRCTSFN